MSPSRVAETLANGLRQIAHPPQGLIDAFAEEPEVPPEWNLAFASALSRLLTATSAGLLSESHRAKPLPPGSRTRASAPLVAWCTCRAPRQASLPRFWPPGQR
jgi:hypothetical protein